MKWTNFNIQTFKSLIYFLLIPLSFIYGSITAIRNLLFDYRIFKSVSHNIPIICIGNLSVGGTGKTPHTQYIIDLLNPDYRVAVLSRGYGRKTSTLQYIETTSNATEVGDEPLQLKLNNPNCIVVVEKNRNKGVKKVLKDFPVKWKAKIENLPKQTTIVIANEFFDALPINQYRRKSGQWMEVMVTLKDLKNLTPKEFCFQLIKTDKSY